MYLLPVFLPALNFILLSLFGRLLGWRISFFVILNMLVGVLTSFIILYEVSIYGSVCFINLGSWFHVGVLRLNWIFMFDTITSVMILLVIFISFLVHLYSMDYMSEDPHIIRFLGYLSLFTFFMLMLVTAGTFVQLFLGWEGVGLSSYLLINFWYTRIQANKSAMKAIIVNRFGDFGIYFALLLIFYFFRCFDFSLIFNLTYLAAFSRHFQFLGFSFNYVDLICLFLFIGALGKSAQLGLHTWLPDAMEGPTPVSALIHAATMVTAGVFVIVRASPILEYSSNILLLISLLGGLTAFFAGTVGLVQYDLKKVIAYSTCSQLGYMFFACGMSNYSVALFHLFNHGFFKALLFLGAGSVIHALLDEQDMRKMGGLINILPLTYVVILIGSLSLTGFPFLAGFYSKEVILEIAFCKFTVNSYFIYWLGIVAAFITSFYSTRLIYLVFFTSNNSYPKAISASHESFSFIFYILSILAFLSVFVGFIFRDAFIGTGTSFWSYSLLQLHQNTDLLVAEFLSYHFKLIPLISSFLGVFVSLIIYFIWYTFTLRLLDKPFFISLYYFLIKKWYFDMLYNNVFVFGLLNLFYKISFKLVDRGLIEFFGPLTISRLLAKWSLLFSKFQTGHIYNYIFAMLLGAVFFLKITQLALFGYFSATNLNLLLCFWSIIMLENLRRY